MSEIRARYYMHLGEPFKKIIGTNQQIAMPVGVSLEEYQLAQNDFQPIPEVQAPPVDKCQK